MCALYVYVGPMFSGKSKTELTDLSEYSIAGKRVLRVTHEKDTREYASHSTVGWSSDDSIVNMKAEFLANVDVDEYDVIGVDEGQFFTDLVSEVTEWVEIKGKIVIVAGLDADYKRKKFGKIADLLPLSTEFVKRTAVCVGCSKNGNIKRAPHTGRIIPDTKLEVIGGKDKYVALCLSCHIAHEKVCETKELAGKCSGNGKCAILDIGEYATNEYCPHKCQLEKCSHCETMLPSIVSDFTGGRCTKCSFENYVTGASSSTTGIRCSFCGNHITKEDANIYSGHCISCYPRILSIGC